MAIVKTPEEQELELLKKVEKEMKHHIRMERIHHYVIGALGALAIASFFAGRFLRR